MGQAREPSPEKQLLKLIEDPEIGETRKKLIGRKGFKFLSLGALRGRLSFFIEHLRDFHPSGSEAFNIKKINVYLKIWVFIIAIYFLVSFSVSAFRMEKRSAIGIEVEVNEGVAVAAIPKPLKKLSYYLEKVRGADIFKPSWGEDESDNKGNEAQRIAASEMQAMVDSYRLVGISWSGDPDAMIESVEDGKIYFAKKGEMVGDMKIEGILKDKVIVSYKGKEFTLK